MEELWKIVLWMVSLGAGYAVPGLALLLVMFIRYVLIASEISRTNPSPPEGELTLRLMRDRYVWIAAVYAIVWIFTYQLSVAPIASAGLFFKNLNSWVLLPFGPALLSLTIALSFRRWSGRAIATILTLIVLSSGWIYAYFYWFGPQRPQDPSRIVIQVLPVERTDKDYSWWFIVLAKYGESLPVWIRPPLTESVPLDSPGKQASSAQELRLKAGADAVLWIATTDRGTYLNAVFDPERDTDHWDLPLPRTFDASTLNDSPGDLLRLLVAGGLMRRGRCKEALNVLAKVKDTRALNIAALDWAYCEIELGQLGKACAALNKLSADNFSDAFFRGQYYYLLGKLYSRAVNFSERQPEYLSNNSILGVQNREQALAKAEDYYKQALESYPAGSTCKLERARVLLALGFSVGDPDPLLGELADRAPRAKTYLEEALGLLKNLENTRVELGLIDYQLGSVEGDMSLFFEGNAERFYLNRSIFYYKQFQSKISKREDKDLYAVSLLNMGRKYSTLADLEAGSNADNALNAFREAKLLTENKDIKASINSDLCDVAGYFAAPELPPESEATCRNALIELAHGDVLDLTRAQMGLGNLMDKMADVQMVGADPRARLREAQGAYRASLHILNSLPQTRFVRMRKDRAAERLNEIERKLNALH
jgi:hypothetical protein